MSDESNTPESAPVTGSKRGRKPSVYTPAILASDVEAWARGGTLPEGKYNVTPQVVKENGFVEKFAVVSTPPQLRVGSDGNTVSVVRYSTDGTMRQRVITIEEGSYQFDGKRFIRVKVDAAE